MSLSTKETETKGVRNRYLTRFERNFRSFVSDRIINISEYCLQGRLRYYG